MGIDKSTTQGFRKWKGTLEESDYAANVLLAPGGPGLKRIGHVGTDGRLGRDAIDASNAYHECKHWFPVDPANPIYVRSLEAQLASHIRRFGRDAPLTFVFRGADNPAWREALQTSALKQNFSNMQEPVFRNLPPIIGE
jgi:hypothetical protein